MKTTSSATAAFLPHIWISYGSGHVPHCRFCQTNSIQAQKDQPETKGAGPCPKRIALAA